MGAVEIDEVMVTRADVLKRRQELFGEESLQKQKDPESVLRGIDQKKRNEAMDRYIAKRNRLIVPEGE